MNNVLPNIAATNSSMNFENLVTINVSGSVDSSSVSTITSAVKNGFAELQNAFASRGTLRTANNFR